MRLGLGLLVVAIALSACGGTSTPSLSVYKAGFQSDKAAFHRLGLDLQSAIVGAQTKTDSQLAAELGAIATRAAAEARQIARLNAPARYKADTTALAAGFRGVATDLRAISSAAAKHDAASARAGTLTLLRDAAKVKASDDAISKGLGLPPG